MPQDVKEECQELRNIRFRSGSGTSVAPEAASEEASAVEAILDTESSERRCRPWSRLDPAVRARKLHDYAEVLIAEQSLDAHQAESLKEAFRMGAQRRRLERARDVQYDRTTEAVVAVPNLIYNQTSRRYTLKRSDKRVSTLKSLAPGRGPRARARAKARKRPRKGAGAEASRAPAGAGAVAGVPSKKGASETCADAQSGSGTEPK